MKYKNVSGHDKHFKRDCLWQTIQDGEFVELSKAEADSEGGMELVEETPVKKEPTKEVKKEVNLLEKKELEKLTKDGLNDYAARLGLDSVNPAKQKHADMVKDILKYQNGLK